MVWVVETGMAVKVASSTKVPAAKRADIMAIMYSDICELQYPHAQQSGVVVDATPWPPIIAADATHSDLCCQQGCFRCSNRSNM
jgi:hypothetical protein